MELNTAVTFTCDAAEVVSPIISWYVWKKDEKTIQNLTSSHWTWTIHKLDDEGTYSCQVGNSHGTSDMSTPVIIHITHG